MLVQLIQVDNDSGKAGARMGRGPEQILRGGAADRLRCAGHQVETIRIESREPFPLEIATAFEIASSLSRQVRMASRQRRFPVILAGNCMASLGVLGGLPSGRIGIVWFDAHGDLHTPETTRSGFLDGMALATAMGLCWTRLTTAVPGFHPVRAADVLLLGARDLDEAELKRIDELEIFWRNAEAIRADPAAVEVELDRLADEVDRVHLHLDLDVLDPEGLAPANAFASPGGLCREELLDLVAAVRTRARLSSATLSAYDPSVDPEGAVREAAISVLATLCE